jgi:elongation factor Ts
MSLRRAAELSVGKGVVGGYVHNSVSEGLGKMGVLIGLESAGKTEELAELARLLAQHVAAANPQAVDAASLDPAAIAREKTVLAEKAKEQGKPANVIDKIVEGGLKAFYKEVCLLDQGYIREEKKSVGQVLKEAEAKVGAPIKVKGFVRYLLGEGIEKQETDFAAEVAAASGVKKPDDKPGGPVN